ncbi:HIT-type Zinc finger family protein [Striga asiatica]|uniref:HIT-type Zinc finger family protein n=1 Tax=Striga asiatica TaxID=4170 RepID=A0A5A7PGP6_STRAF|nr:HIT-type Zinc finger family protein [Striga asiatica]
MHDDIKKATLAAHIINLHGRAWTPCKGTKDPNSFQLKNDKGISCQKGIGGRNGNGPRFVCQVCNKEGLTTNRCYYRYDSNYNGFPPQKDFNAQNQALYAGCARLGVDSGSLRVYGRRTAGLCRDREMGLRTDR